MSLLPASPSLAVSRAGVCVWGCLCCARGSPSLKMWPASPTARSEDQPRSPAAPLACVLCRVRALHAFSPRLRAHAPPDPHRHWLLPVANPRDRRRHAPPLLLLARRVPADVRCCLAPGSSPALDGASGRPRCSRRPQGGSAALRVHPPLAAPAQPFPAKVFQPASRRAPALSSPGRAGDTRRGPGWLWGDLQGTHSLSQTRRNSLVCV